MVDLSYLKLPFNGRVDYLVFNDDMVDIYANNGRPASVQKVMHCINLFRKI